MVLALVGDSTITNFFEFDLDICFKIWPYCYNLSIVFS